MSHRYTTRLARDGLIQVLDTATGSPVHITRDTREATRTAAALNRPSTASVTPHRSLRLTNALFAFLRLNDDVHPDTLAARAASTR